MLRSIRGDVVWGALALAMFIALSLAKSAHDRTAVLSTPSTYDAGRYGYRAFYDLLRAQDVPVQRFERDHHYLGETGATLVIAESNFDAASRQFRAPSHNEIVAIKDWVLAGGRLVVLSPQFGDENDTLFGIPATRTMRRPSSNVQPFVDFPVTRGVRQVGGAFVSEFAWSAAPKAVPLLVTGSGIVGLSYRLGRGSVVVLTDPDIFGNGRLAQLQNARFGVQLMRMRPPVLFDESVHGYAQDRTLWQALPQPVQFGAYLAMFAIALGVLGNLVRFAPALSGALPSERDSSAYITSMANLLARARASRKALRDAAGSALRAVRRTLGESDRTRITALLSRLQNAQQRDAVLELDRLTDVEHPSDAELLRAGVLASQLRKDFGL